MLREISNESLWLLRNDLYGPLSSGGLAWTFFLSKWLRCLCNGLLLQSIIEILIALLPRKVAVAHGLEELLCHYYLRVTRAAVTTLSIVHWFQHLFKILSRSFRLNLLLLRIRSDCKFDLLLAVPMMTFTWMLRLLWLLIGVCRTRGGGSSDWHGWFDEVILIGVMSTVLLSLELLLLILLIQIKLIL
jgi:hypothetical protein